MRLVKKFGLGSIRMQKQSACTDDLMRLDDPVCS